MKDLLKNHFTSAYDPSGNPHTVQLLTFQGHHSFGDQNASRQCHSFFRDGGCEQLVFKVFSLTHINKIDIEEFLNEFRIINGDRCDLLLYNDSKIVLADMYCGSNDYIAPHNTDGKPVVGKKAKVRKQIESTLDVLYSIPEIAHYIDSKSHKIGIMAYRDKYEGHFDNNPAKIKASIGSFLKPTEALGRRNMIIPIAHGFAYMVNKYPHVYQW